MGIDVLSDRPPYRPACRWSIRQTPNFSACANKHQRVSDVVRALEGARRPTIAGPCAIMHACHKIRCGYSFCGSAQLTSRSDVCVFVTHDGLVHFERTS